MQALEKQIISWFEYHEQTCEDSRNWIDTDMATENVLNELQSFIDDWEFLDELRKYDYQQDFIDWYIRCNQDLDLFKKELEVYINELEYQEMEYFNEVPIWIEQGYNDYNRNY